MITVSAPAASSRRTTAAPIENGLRRGSNARLRRFIHVFLRGRVVFLNATRSIGHAVVIGSQRAAAMNRRKLKLDMTHSAENGGESITNRTDIGSYRWSMTGVRFTYSVCMLLSIIVKYSSL